MREIKGYETKLIAPDLAEVLCREITASLPEYFGIPEANENYAKGMQERISFSINSDEKEIGLLTLEFPFHHNANIYWMGVLPEFHGQHAGTTLIQTAAAYCRQQGCASMTVETLSPKENDPHYFKTYHFYEKMGFKPLFELAPYNHFLMVYLQKTI